jgi:hypothetical protein
MRLVLLPAAVSGSQLLDYVKQAGLLRRTDIRQPAPKGKGPALPIDGVDHILSPLTVSSHLSKATVRPG